MHATWDLFTFPGTYYSEILTEKHPGANTMKPLQFLKA